MSAAPLLRAGERLAVGGLCALALFALVAHALLLVHGSVPAWLLPAATAVGLAVARPRRELPAGAAATPWLALAAATLVATAVVAVAIGSTATPSRCWDGAVAWDLKAHALTEAPTLQQPFFRDWAVFCHSRDYPLTLPLLLAGGEWLGIGRLPLAMLYALLLLLVGTTLRRAGSGGTLAWLGALAVSLTPMLVNPSSGAVDSGYADPLLLLATTGMAAGMLTKAPLPLAAGALLAVLSKPEGLLYGALPIAVLFVTADRALLRAAVLGWLCGAAIWLPLQRDLATFGEREFAWQLAFAAAAFAALVLAVDALLPRQQAPRLSAAALAVPLLLLVPIVWARTSGDTHSTLGLYLADPMRALSRLLLLPQIVLGMLRFALLKQFGLAFWLLLALVAGAVATRRRLLHVPLAALLALGLCAVITPFLLSPETDLEHHLKSSMGRLLLHWLGPALLFATAELAAWRRA